MYVCCVSVGSSGCAKMMVLFFHPSLKLTWTNRKNKGIIFCARRSFRWAAICKQVPHLSMLQSDKRGRRPPE